MGYRVCGKTGTSEKVDKHNQDRSKPMEYIASYCGFAPAEDPQYALLVFFDEPGGDDLQNNQTGGNAVAGAGRTSAAVNNGVRGRVRVGVGENEG